VRNYRLSHEFVPATTQGGTSFFIGNGIIRHYSLAANSAGLAPENEGDRLYNDIRDRIRRENPSLSDAQIEVEVDRRLTRMIPEYILGQPLKFVEKVLKGLIPVWFLGDNWIKSTGLFFMQIPLLLLCIVGIYYSQRDKRQVQHLLAFLIYFLIIQTSLSPYGRYSYPTILVLVGFARECIRTDPV